MANLEINPQASANAVLYYRLKVVCNLSIAALIFCFIVPAGGVAAIIAASPSVQNIKIELFTCGMIFGLHVFWVPPIMFITSILGICGYRGGIYRQCPAIAHLVFSILSIIVVIGGLVVCGAAIANMHNFVNIIIHSKDVIHLPWTPPPPQEDLILGYCGAGLIAAFYVYFLYYCLHGAVMFCKVPRQTLTYTYVSTTMPKPLENDLLPESGSLAPGTYSYSV